MFPRRTSCHAPAGRARNHASAHKIGLAHFLNGGRFFANSNGKSTHANRPAADSTVVSIGDVRVDLAARLVFRANQEVHLTPLEYKLLVTLLRHSGKVLTHRFLLREVWGPQDSQETHYLRVFIASLRRKLEAEPARPRYILTEPGVGYRLVAE